jgi:hypothetical protein
MNVLGTYNSQHDAQKAKQKKDQIPLYSVAA